MPRLVSTHEIVEADIAPGTQFRIGYSWTAHTGKKGIQPHKLPVGTLLEIVDVIRGEAWTQVVFKIIDFPPLLNVVFTSQWENDWVLAGLKRTRS